MLLEVDFKSILKRFLLYAYVAVFLYCYLEIFQQLFSVLSRCILVAQVVGISNMEFQIRVFVWESPASIMCFPGIGY